MLGRPPRRAGGQPLSKDGKPKGYRQLAALSTIQPGPLLHYRTVCPVEFCDVLRHGRISLLRISAEFGGKTHVASRLPLGPRPKGNRMILGGTIVSQG